MHRFRITLPDLIRTRTARGTTKYELITHRRRQNSTILWSQQPPVHAPLAGLFATHKITETTTKKRIWHRKNCLPQWHTGFPRSFEESVGCWRLPPLDTYKTSKSLVLILILSLGALTELQCLLIWNNRNHVPSPVPPDLIACPSTDCLTPRSATMCDCCSRILSSLSACPFQWSWVWNWSSPAIDCSPKVESPFELVLMEIQIINYFRSCDAPLKSYAHANKAMTNEQLHAKRATKTKSYSASSP